MGRKMKELNGRNCDLYDYFRCNYGKPNSKEFKQAQMNFADSLAAYSLASYILQIKDRHNANIILTKNGHVVHIDFGFLLTSAPGKGLKFETAPFKLTTSFVRVLGGHNGDGFKRFRVNMIEGMMELHK
jgi:phosphatidylinositol 4-kinase B